jgi:hypothetical protein
MALIPWDFPNIAPFIITYLEFDKERRNLRFIKSAGWAGHREKELRKEIAI